MSRVDMVELGVEFEIVKILSEYLSVCHGKIESSSNLVEDLQLDSIGVVEVVMILSERFSIVLPESGIGEWRIVKDIFASVNGVLEK